jgi:hypothetical protein
MLVSKKKPTLPVSISAAAMYSYVIDLPQNITEGIGLVVSAHAILETRVQELLFDLMVVHYHAGRIAFAYRDPSVLFKTIVSLIVAWGIRPSIDAQKLAEEIGGHTRRRNELAHCIWIKLPDGSIALRLTEGNYDTADGTHSRATLPQPFVPPKNYFSSTREGILSTVQKISNLKDEVKPSLPPLPDISQWR